jgi:hypothetical protein
VSGEALITQALMEQVRLQAQRKNWGHILTFNICLVIFKAEIEWIKGKREHSTSNAQHPEKSKAESDQDQRGKLKAES